MSRIRVAVAPDLRPLARAVGGLGPEFRQAMKDESYSLATLETPRIRAAAGRAPHQGPRMADSVKAMRSSSLATVKAGGRGTFRPKSKKHGKRATYVDVLWGSEFGGRPGTGWPARRRSGWWFTPTVKRDAPWLIRLWADAAAATIARAVGR